MDVIVTGQSSIEVLATGQPNIEAVAQGQPTLEIDATKESVVEARIVRDSTIKCVLTARVIDSYKDVDNELSSSSENPVQNKVVTKALEDMRQSTIVLTQAEYDSIKDKEDKLYFIYEE